MRNSNCSKYSTLNMNNNSASRTQEITIVLHKTDKIVIMSVKLTAVTAHVSWTVVCDVHILSDLM
jgi:hypothetical protein